jgi:threonine dehydrogenase-like Zn-dependent dehydrogenase
MQAVVFHGVGDIRLEDVPEPQLQGELDAVVRITASAICGTDLHLVRGTAGTMRAGTILGHEGVGLIEQRGKGVRNLLEGDRVVICSTIACGSCVYCRAGYQSQCDEANPLGPRAGTAFFGGPENTGSFDGLQAEKARVPFAHVTCVKLPDEVSDEQAILPTGYFGAKLAEVTAGDVVLVFGCGPVGQFAIRSAFLLGAGRVIAVDNVVSRLAQAKALGAEVINFDQEDPVTAILELTHGIGADRAIDAVGVDANCPRSAQARIQGGRATSENWRPGNAPAQALEWAVQGLAKAGTLGVIGVYPPSAHDFPIGEAMNKNLTLKMGNCNHRRYVPELIEMVQTHRIDPKSVLTQHEPFSSAIAAYEAFDRREPGWTKVELRPTQSLPSMAVAGREEGVFNSGAPLHGASEPGEREESVADELSQVAGQLGNKVKRVVKKHVLHNDDNQKH